MTTLTKTSKRFQKIDPNKTYSIKEITDLGLFYFCSDIRTVRAWVEKDRLSKNKLKAIISGDKRGKRYYIKGINIITFLANIEDNSYSL